MIINFLTLSYFKKKRNINMKENYFKLKTANLVRKVEWPNKLQFKIFLGTWITIKKLEN